MKFASAGFKCAAIAGLGLGLLAPSLALAAETIPKEAVDQLTSQADTFLEESRRTPAKPEVPVQISGEDGGPAVPASPSGGASFTLKEVVFEGNTLLTAADLARFTAPSVGTEVSFDSLKKICDDITAEYRRLGYTTSGAYLPPQKIAGGVVKIAVIEGKMGRFLVEGNRHFASDLYLQNMTLQAGEPFRYTDLDNDIYFLNQKPDRSAQAYLVPDPDHPDRVDVTLKAREVSPLHFYYDLNNRGTKLTHRLRHGTGFLHNNITGHGDTLSGSFQFAEEGALAGGSGSYALPFDRTGTTLRLSGGVTDTMLVKHLKPFEVKGESLSLSAEVAQSLIRTRTSSLEAVFGYDHKNSESLIDDFRTGIDRTRIIRGGSQITLRDGGGATSANFDANKGIPDLDASEESFFYLSGGVTRIQRLTQELTLTLRARGQWTDDSLPSLEQYRVGGMYSVRGYAESDSSGDSGFDATAELTAPLPTLSGNAPVFFGGMPRPWSEALKVAAFVDGGAVFLRERDSDTTVAGRRLAGTGVGFVMNLNDNWSGRVDLGFPIGDEAVGNENWQTHFSMKFAV